MQPEGGATVQHWLYASNCAVAPAWAGPTVEALVAHAALRNAECGLSGALLFTGQHFIQTLEGPATALAQMRSTICDDVRHTHIMTLAEGTLPYRRFDGWALAYAGASVYLAGQVRTAMADGAPALLSLLQAFARPLPGANPGCGQHRAT